MANESKQIITSLVAFRPHLFSSAGLLLITFITVLLFLNLILQAVFVSKFWPSFALAVAVLALGITAVRQGFSKIPKKRWHIFFSTILTIGTIAAAPLFFVQGIQHSLARANFYFVRDDYLSQVDRVKRTDVPRFIIFRWNSFNQELLIFDESGELDNGSAIKSKDWWLRAKQAEYELAACHWSSMKVAEHFYRVGVSCEHPYAGSPIPP